jgi:hypothetical protein
MPRDANDMVVIEFDSVSMDWPPMSMLWRNVLVILYLSGPFPGIRYVRMSPVSGSPQPGWGRVVAAQPARSEAATMVAMIAAILENVCLSVTWFLLSMGPACAGSVSSLTRAYTKLGRQGTRIPDWPT